MSVVALIKAALEQNRALLLLVAVLALVAGGMFFYPQGKLNAELIKLRLQQKNIQQEVRQRQAARGSVPMSSETTRISEELKLFQGLIPDKKQLSTFIGDLFSWAEAAHLNIKQISYAPKLDQDLGFLRYGLSFSVSGEYVQLKRFVHLLENSPRILIIDQIALAGGEAGELRESVVQLQIHLTTYFRDQAND